MTSLNHRCFRLALATALSIGTSAGVHPAAAAPRAQSPGIPAAQLDLAASMEDDLVQRPEFTSRVAAFHGGNAIRFAGMARGEQRRMIRSYLDVVRHRSWSVSPTGSMIRDDWYSREAAAIHDLQTDPDVLRRVARAEGLSTEELVALRMDLLAQRVRRNTVFEDPIRSPQASPAMR